MRWDLTIGPPSREWACALPEEARLSRGTQRKAIAGLEKEEFARLKQALANQANWAPLAGTFAYERDLSDFIAAFPERLDAGLRPNPAVRKIREHVPARRHRIDVFLQDEQGAAVIVECKRDTPSVADLEQLHEYMRVVESKTGQAPRGILVFGGAPNPSKGILKAAGEMGVELVAYKLEVSFTPCHGHMAIG